MKDWQKLNTNIKSNTSTKTNWYKNHMLTEEEKKILIEEKLKRATLLAEATRKLTQKLTA